MTDHAFTELANPKFKQLLNQCIHCGLCLEACPTYAVFGTEMDSPRGRIAQMRAVSEGRIESPKYIPTFREHIELCLACLSCQTACPSGVQYGELVTITRSAIESQRKLGAIERLIRWIGFKQLLPDLGRLKKLAQFIRYYETSGLQKIARKYSLLPPVLRDMEAILPPIELSQRDFSRPAAAIGQKYGEVGFFTGCIQEAFLSKANEATIRVLQRNGYEVHFPKGQTCCGAAQLHMGEPDLARSLALINMDAFEPYEVIINNAGGCGATLKNEYIYLFKDDPTNLDKARKFSAKVKDISEFLVEHLNVSPHGEIPIKAAYVDSCHLRHSQKIIQQPRLLLKKIPGLELLELRQPDRCCGSAGIYNIVQADTANEILDAKMEDIAASGADLIICSNTGCHMQLLAGIRKSGIKARVAHIMEVLEMSYQKMDEDRKFEQE